MLLMIDNYDSFTYNVVQYLGELGADVKVVRNDELTVAEIEALNPERIVVSPGPCTPNEAGVSVPVLKHFAGKLPILGICLGHQSIGQAFGGDVVVSGSLLPALDSTSNLGSATNRWDNVYTGDLHLRNEKGNWTIQEDEDKLIVINNMTGKRYKMMLEPLEDEE